MRAALDRKEPPKGFPGSKSSANTRLSIHHSASQAKCSSLQLLRAKTWDSAAPLTHDCMVQPTAAHAMPLKGVLCTCGPTQFLAPSAAVCCKCSSQCIKEGELATSGLFAVPEALKPIPYIETGQEGTMGNRTQPDSGI